MTTSLSYHPPIYDEFLQDYHEPDSRRTQCDRANPCTPCVRAGQQCVSSAFSSAPRGRQGGRPRKVDTELLDRIAKLENLVKNMEGDTSNPNTGVRPTAAQTRAVTYSLQSLIDYL